MISYFKLENAAEKGLDVDDSGKTAAFFQSLSINFE